MFRRTFVTETKAKDDNEVAQITRAYQRNSLLLVERMVCWAKENLQPVAIEYRSAPID